MLGLCGCMCSRGCVCTGGLVHSEIQIHGSLPCSRASWDLMVSGCHPFACLVRRGVGVPGMCQHQDREHWKGVFTTDHPQAAAELPPRLQRAKHTQLIVNNNITEFFHIPDSSQHPQRSLSCSSTAQSQWYVIASQPWVLPGTPLPFPLPPPGPYHPFPYCTWPHQHQGWQENGKYGFN